MSNTQLEDEPISYMQQAGLHKDLGFTLIELLVVIAIISLLSSVVLASLSGARSSARDARRLQDMKQIQTALEMYYNNNGQYPEEDGDGRGSWDNGDDGDFLQTLVGQGYLSSTILDPAGTDRSSNDYKFGYSYYRYNPGDYGCTKGHYYVLGIRDLETIDGNFNGTKHTGPNHPDSPGWSCPNRDWQDEFEWVAGSFE